MQIVTVSLLGSLRAGTLNLNSSTGLVLYFSKILDNTLKNEEVQAN